MKKDLGSLLKVFLLGVLNALIGAGGLALRALTTRFVARCVELATSILSRGPIS